MIPTCTKLVFCFAFLWLSLNTVVKAQTEHPATKPLLLGKLKLQQRYVYYLGDTLSDKREKNLGVKNREAQKTSKNDVNFSITSLMEKNIATGHAFSHLDHRYSDVVKLLNSMENWCFALILNVNIKTCTYKHETDALKYMHFYVEDEHYVAPENAYHIRYQFHIVDQGKDYLYVKLNADEGPYDTSDYTFLVEIIPTEDNRSFIHLAYSTHFGWLSRLFLNTYLATIGRNKIGFTVIGRYKDGQVKYIRGIKAIMERTTARYVLAFQAYLEAQVASPENRFMAGLKRWHAYSKLFRPQLYELSNIEYIANKQREFKNQQHLQELLLEN